MNNKQPYAYALQKVMPALVAALALAVSGCSGDREAAGVSGREELTHSYQLLNEPFTVAIPQVGEIFDAASVLPAEISAVSFNIYDWMFDRNHDGSVKPGYAKSWEQSADAKQLTVSLREDVTFHNGMPMTAEDVVFSWDRIVQGGYSSRITRALESIEIIDTHTLRLSFNKPEVAFIAVGGFPVLSKAYFESVGEQQFKRHPMGTGPYAFKQLVRGQYIDLERYDEYWGEKPEISKARLKFVTEGTTRVAQLRTGEADMIMMAPYPLVAQIESDPALKTVVLSPGGMTVFLALKANNPKTPWADRRVREAIALAVDKNAIVQHILHGYPQHFPFMAPSDLGFDANLKPYPYEPVRAKQLIEQAGYDGMSLELRYIASGVTGLRETAEAVALYLTDIGIKTTTTPIEGPQFIPWVLKASRNPDQDYVAVFVGGIAGRSEASSPIVAQFGEDTPFAWYANPSIYEMVKQMSGVADKTARANAIQAIGKAVHEDMRYIPLWTSAHVYGLKRCMKFSPTLGEYDLLLLRDIKISGCDSKSQTP